MAAAFSSSSGIERRKFGDAAEQGIDAGAHFGFVGPLAMQSLLEDVDGFEADVDDGGRRIDFAVAEAADQVFDAMGDGAEALQADLRGRTFYRVNGAEETIDLFGIVVAFERDQAVADDLQMLFGFGLEEFQDFGADFVVGGQSVEVGAGERLDWRTLVRAADSAFEPASRDG